MKKFYPLLSAFICRPIVSLSLTQFWMGDGVTGGSRFEIGPF